MITILPCTCKYMYYTCKYMYYTCKYMYYTCKYMYYTCHFLPQAIKSSSTVNPTKFFSLICPRKVLMHSPVSVDHSFNSLSVDLHVQENNMYSTCTNYI